MLNEQRYQLETLTRQHFIGDFACGYAEIDDYLRSDALTDMARGVALTFVEVDKENPVTNTVAGFFTLRAHAKLIDESYFDDFEQDEDSRRIGLIEVPLIELMYLARDTRWRGLGLGDALMVDAIQTVAKAADCIGFIGMHLRSTPQGKALYERYDFELFREHPSYDGNHYILPTYNIRTISERVEQQ